MSRSSASKVRHWFDFVVTATIFAAIGALIYSLLARQAAGPVGPLPLPTEPMSIEGDQIKGKASAKVAVIVFSDYDCPACAALVLDGLPLLERKYVEKGYSLLVLKNLPLEGGGARAFEAAVAAQCAADAGRFWEVHDAMSKSPDPLSGVSLLRIVSGRGLSDDSLKACLSWRSAQWKRIRDNQALADRFGITSTPTALVGLVTGDRQVSVRSRVSGDWPAIDLAVAKLITTARRQ